MGLIMSFMPFMGKGLPSAQMLNFAMGMVSSQFMKKDITNFEDFHIAILDIFNIFNESLPGKHYDAPPRNEIEACFAEWKAAEESAKKKVFIEFMKAKVKPNKLDNTSMITGLVTPLAAMAAKRAGESVPQLRIIKSIPDVAFVPSATVLALVSVKLSRRLFVRNVHQHHDSTLQMVDNHVQKHD